MDIVRVQRWVMSSLLLATAFLFAAGLALISLFLREDRDGGQIGLLVIAGIIGIAAVVGVRFINEKSWLTPWLVVGLLPAAIGAYFAFLA